MALIINIIAALILFLIPIYEYRKGQEQIVPAPFDKGIDIVISYPLWFLVYSVVTAMIFLGPLSLTKYVYWIIFLLFLAFSRRLEYKGGAIVGTYMLFVVWALISAVFFSTVKFQAVMMLIKYILPLFYLWLGYTAINDSDDLTYFMKKVAIGMCVYAILIGGFAAKFLRPIYLFLNFQTDGLVISYASLADYFSGLIVIPISLYIITTEKKWLWATLWIILSTILETVRTGLGGILFAISLFMLTLYRTKAVPWIAGLFIVATAAVFLIPSFHEKMFIDEKTTMSSFSTSEINFDNIQSNAREYIWDMNLTRFYEPHKITGAGLGESVEYTKNLTKTKLIHSDYVQILSDMGLLGISLFGLFVLVTLFSITSSAWASESPYILKLTGGMALGSCAGTFFSMAFDNVVTYAQQSFVIPFILIGVYLKIRNLYNQGAWE